MRISLSERWLLGPGTRARKLAGVDVAGSFTLTDALGERAIIDETSDRPVPVNECPADAFGCQIGEQRGPDG